MADSSKPGHGGDGSQSARLAQQRFAGQDTTPSATIALGGGDDSSDRDTDENEGSCNTLATTGVTSSASRAAALKRKKVRRASLHIVSFIRVNVQASPTVNFSVTVDSSRTVEYLASLIEAEYAFRFTHLAQRFPPDQAARDNPNGVVTEPLVVGFLCDTQGRELNFQSPISAVLNLGDIVTVSHGAEEGEITQMMSHVTEDLDDIVTDSSGQGLESRFDLYSPQSVVSPGILDSTSDNRFTALLRNMAGITLFREFCQVELQLEALLFWMEVEIFTSTTPELRWLMAKYIYFMYIVDNAPLIINVPEDIRTDITASLGSQSDVQIFDEAQLHVYCLLKKQVFPKFEKTDKFKDFLRFRMTNPQAYFSAKIRNKYADNFKPNLELMLEICGGAGFAFHGLTPVHVKEKFLSRVIKRYFPSAAGVDGYWTQVAHVATAQRVRKVQKEKKLTKFFGVERDSKDRAQLRDEMVRQMARVDGDGGGATEGTGPGSRSSSNMDLTRELLLPAENDSGGGSEDGMNVDATTDDAASVDDLYARKRRADKLVEFFGKSVQRELGAAGVTQTGLPSVSNGDGGALPHSSGGYLGGAQAGQRPSRRGSTNDHTTITAGVVSAMTAMVGGGTAASDRASGGEIKTMVSTMNELPSETKAMLTRRSKKLRYVLGEALDENMAYDALLREVFAAPDRDRRVSSGGVKPIRASGTATSGVASLTDDVGEEGEEVDPFDDDDALTFQEEDDDVFLSDDDGDDAHSFATTSTHERKNAHLSKVRRRGKLEQLLGEGKIPTAAQGTPAPVIVLPSTTPARPATHEEQVKRRQRATKLEKVFGAPLPIEALTDVQRRTLEHRRSIVSVSRMLADSSALSSVLEHLAHASSPSGPSFLAPTLGESGGSAAASSGSGTFESPAGTL
ncbi:hypothetical protein BC828DRAFT_105443 [Blastocladiella britannica]|nr:hypothetical protein BC828DRAFT_105443 [Blastocladiella britannica]